VLQLRLLSPSVRPFHWPCIPDEVFRVIRQCTDFRPDQRPSVQDLETRLNALKKELKVAARQTQYPAFKISQERRRHLPEKVSH
jgi:hypothetical protein